MTTINFNANLKTADRTLAAVEDAVLARRKDWRRPHLGASLIGGSCTAALWWSFRWATAPDHSPRLLRLFARGQREEDVIVAFLRDAGFTVIQNDPNTGNQYEYHDGHFGGSMDGAIQGLPESKAWHVAEYKTAALKPFEKLVKEGVQRAQPKHYVQMQCYMQWTGMERALYVTVCKNDDRLHMERVDYDPAVADKYNRRAQDIIASDVPLDKISTDPTWYECKWCEHHATCHGNQPPLVSCRTCTHITFRRDGTTHCGLYDVLLPVENQRQGCESHLYSPAVLANWATPIDASEEDNWVKYYVPAIDAEIVNGQGDGHFTSHEIEAAPDASLFVDPKVLAIRERFDARLAK